jgi:hypothetical protein
MFRSLDSVCVFRWSLSPETTNSSVDWAQLNSYHLKTETESSLRNAAFQIKNRTMDNVQNFNSYITVSPNI